MGRNRTSKTPRQGGTSGCSNSQGPPIQSYFPPLPDSAMQEENSMAQQHATQPPPLLHLEAWGVNRAAAEAPAAAGLSGMMTRSRPATKSSAPAMLCGPPSPSHGETLPPSCALHAERQTAPRVSLSLIPPALWPPRSGPRLSNPAGNLSCLSTLGIAPYTPSRLLTFPPAAAACISSYFNPILCSRLPKATESSPLPRI